MASIFLCVMQVLWFSSDCVGCSKAILVGSLLHLQLPDNKLSCSQTVTSLMKILHSSPTHGFIQFDRAGYTVRRSAQQAKLDTEKVHQKPLIKTLQQLHSFMPDKI